MKSALVIVLTSVLVSVCNGFLPSDFTYGDVNIRGVNPRPPISQLTVAAWNAAALPGNIDSALQRARFAETLILKLPECSGVDTTCLKEIAGRFTPFPLSRLVPCGTWQWDRPLVITLADSSSCPFMFKLQERRWTTIVLGDDEYGTNAKAVAVELADRYRRERVDRMEEMFRK